MSNAKPSLMKTTIYALASLLLLLLNKVNAQTNVPKYQFGLNVGAIVYQGDLSPSPAGSFKTMKPAINLFASRILSPTLSLRANLTIGGLKGDEAKYNNPEYRQQRAFNFHSSLVEVSALGE